MADNKAKIELIGKIHLCEDLKAWGTEISLTQLNEILEYIEQLEKDYKQVEKRANGYEQQYWLLRKTFADYVDEMENGH